MSHSDNLPGQDGTRLPADLEAVTLVPLPPARRPGTWPGSWQEYWQDGVAADDPGDGTQELAGGHRAHRRAGRRPGATTRRLILSACAAVLLLVAAAAATGRLGESPAPKVTFPQMQPGRSSQPRPATTASAAPAAAAPAVTLAGARRVLAAYLAANNAANSVRSSSMLAAIEGGASYLMDAGSYRWTRVTDPQNRHYSPITIADPRFYVPQQSGYPLWFAVRGTWAASGGPAGGWASAWLVFTRASAAAPWLDILEPNIIPGSPAIQIARGPGGTPLQVNLASAPGLAVAPASIGQVTAAYLDDAAPGLTGFTRPGNLQDLSDQAFWLKRLPPGSADTDTHTPAAGPVFGLRTTGGGALLFYSLSASLTLTAPAGGPPLDIEIPGYYALTQTESSAQVPYVDQLAVYDPPGSGTRPLVVADSGGVASRD